MNTPESEPNPSTGWRIGRKLLIVLACCATLVAMFYAVENWRGKHAWNTFRAEQEAKGEKLQLTTLAPAPIPDEQNFAGIPLWQNLFRYETNSKTGFKERLGERAFTNWFTAFKSNGRADDQPSMGRWDRGEKIDLAEWQRYYRSTNSSGAYEFPISAQPQSPGEDVLLALSRFDSQLQIIRDAARRPYSRFPVPYQDNFAAILPHLARIKMCSQTLELRILAEQSLNQNDKALEDTLLSLRLIESVRTEPFLISHLVRIAMFSFDVQCIWEGLADHKWSDQQLVILNNELAKLDFLADYHTSMRGERAGVSDFIDVLRQTRDLSLIDNSKDQGPGQGPDPLRVTAFRLAPSGWFYQNKVRCAQVPTECLKLVNVNERIVRPEDVANTSSAVDTELKHFGAYHFILREVTPAISNPVKKFTRAQVLVDEVRIACALERYRMANGTLPEKLDALAPKFLEKIPHDILTGQPLKYRPAQNGQFVLYSVGWNGTDDNGTVEYSTAKRIAIDINKGDWVWPCAM